MLNATTQTHPASSGAFTTIANEDWEAIVQSASNAVSDLSGARFMMIAVGILVVIYINLRLARWLNASIKFDPPHHHQKNHHHSSHHNPKHHHKISHHDHRAH